MNEVKVPKILQPIFNNCGVLHTHDQDITRCGL